MKILVTGGAGFIGSRVVKYLLDAGHQITVLVSGTHEKKYDLPASIKVISFDLLKAEDGVNYFEAFGSPDAMIHLAWGGLPDFKNEAHLNIQLKSQKKFLLSMIENGLKDLTITGTCLEYGIREGELQEDMKPEPTLPYSIAKYELFKIVSDKCIQNNCSLKWLRLFYVYGDGQYPSALYSQMKSAINNKLEIFNMSLGEQERDYLPVERLTEYICKAALQKKVSGVINCCSGSSIRIKEFVSDFFKLHNYSIKLNLGFYPYPDYEPFKFWGNNEKLMRIINHDA